MSSFPTRQRNPFFYEKDDVRVVPIEPVYAVLEVKASLGITDLNRAYENMRSLKTLQKSAYYVQNGPISYTVTLYGREWPIWPVNYFVFAYEGIDLETIAERLRQLDRQFGSAIESRIDSVCVLDRGVICNRTLDGMVSCLPTPTSGLSALRTGKALLLFYALWSNYFSQATIPNFNFIDYIRAVNFD